MEERIQLGPRFPAPGKYVDPEVEPGDRAHVMIGTPGKLWWPLSGSRMTPAPPRWAIQKALHIYWG